MVWAGVTSTGEKTPIIFIEEGLKYNWFLRSMQHLRSLVLLSNKTEPHPTLLILSKKWCNKNMACFWTKELWPPSSLYLNPTDFAVWSTLESNACSSYHPSVTSLKVNLKHCWDKISTKIMHASCNNVTDILRCAVKAKGYIEDKFHFHIPICNYICRNI